jgi:ketosteroid isomerase-like protein
MRSYRAAWVLSMFLLAPPAAAQPPGESPAPPSQVAAADPIEANKDLVRRYLSEVLSAGKLDVLDQLLAPDFVDSTPGAPKDVRGPEVIRAAQARARKIFPEVSYTVEDLIAEGDRVAARYTVRATGRSDSGPGPKVEVTGITIFRIADGKIREAWIINDQIEMFLQLGYSLQPPQQ